jgi:hypothetical protein
MNIFNPKNKLPAVKEYKITDEFEIERETVRTRTFYRTRTKIKTKGVLLSLVLLISGVFSFYGDKQPEEKKLQQFNNYGIIVINPKQTGDAETKPPGLKQPYDRAPQKNLPKCHRNKKRRK